MSLSCYWQWISSSHCQSSLRIHSAIASWIHSYFDNVMTKFMINNRTDAWKTDVNLLNSSLLPAKCWPLLHVIRVCSGRWPDVVVSAFFKICFCFYQANAYAREKVRRFADLSREEIAGLTEGKDSKNTLLVTKIALNTFRAFCGEKHPDKTQDFDEIS